MRLLLLILIAACSRTKPVESKTPLAEVQAKRDVYLSLQKSQMDEFGWLSPKCDGLLFNSLAAYAGQSIDVMKAEKESGLWERHPSFSCYPEESKSTISKDMMSGLILYLFMSKNFDALERILTRCNDNKVAGGLGCEIGEAIDQETYWSRVVLPISTINEIEEMLNKRPTPEPQKVVGFTDHLESLKLYRSALLHKGLTVYEVENLRILKESSPNNAVYSSLYHKYTDGNFSKAISVLMDERYFPSDRLPTDCDRKSHYIFERDEDDDWQPKPDCTGEVHPGIDLTFVVKIMEE